MSTEEEIVQAQTLVMRDLVDVLLGEDLFDLYRRRDRPPESLAEWGLGPGEQWYRIDLADGWVAWRVRCAAALQDYRLSGTEVWAGEQDDNAAIRTLAPDELLARLLSDWAQYTPDSGDSDGGSDTDGTAFSADGTTAAAAVDDLRTAVEHAAVTIRQRRSIGNTVLRNAVGLVSGECLAATRDRPFHPTGRATVGWDAQERERYGPMRRHPLGLAWVAVHWNMLRRGNEPDSDRLHELLLNNNELAALEESMGKAKVDIADYQPLPLHPWQFEHVLGSHFGAELASRSVVPLTNDLGRFTPTASIRTLATHPEGPLHLKLPLGIATLGATRLLPPRYLDNGERAQRVMTDIIGRTDALRSLVEVCDETNWCSWQDQDEFAYRPGHLAAQVRRYPDGLLGDPELRVVPMAALAAHEWDVLNGILDVAAVDGGPVEFFGAVAEALCVLGFGFLGCGALPELHGQNVVLALRGAVVERLVLRDHDTLRIHPEWMQAAGIDEPGYRVKPGAPQSLVLASGRELVGYLQTLGFQVNLYGIADAMARHFGIDESAFWIRLRAAVIDALDRVELPGAVAGVVSQALLSEPDWPSRQVFGPLLRRGASHEVSMPAATGRVPNPLVRSP